MSKLIRSSYKAADMVAKQHLWWRRWGWRYNPFEYLDAARDPHLLEYLVIPKIAKLLRSSDAVMVLAPPGGGKTALRRYLERHALETGGYITPVVIVPSRHPASPHEARMMAVEGLARRLFWQSVHYFRVIPWLQQRDTRHFLGRLWRHYLRPLPELRLLAQWLRDANWQALENFLGPAYSPRPSASTLREIAHVLEEIASDPAIEDSLSVEDAWQEALALLAEWQVHQIWLLVDGLDGFPESASLTDLWPMWAKPLEDWIAASRASLLVALKAFLPNTPGSDEIIKRYEDWPWQFLQWEDSEELYKVWRTRLQAASDGLIDSWDALVDPELRPFEGRLLQTLPLERRLPRYLVERAGEVLRCIGRTGVDYLTVSLWRNLNEKWTLS